MTAFSVGNLLHVGRASPGRAMRGAGALSAWCQALPVLASVLLHGGLAVTAMMHDFSPAEAAVEPTFRKGRTAASAGANVRLVKLTLEGDGFNQGRVRIEPADGASPAGGTPAAKYAKSPQPVREPVPSEAGHAVIDPARAELIDGGGASVALRGVGRGAGGASPAPMPAQPLASAMLSAAAEPARAPVAATQAADVTQVTVVRPRPSRSDSQLPKPALRRDWPTEATPVPPLSPVDVAMVLPSQAAAAKDSPSTGVQSPEASASAPLAAAAAAAAAAPVAPAAAESQAGASQPAGVADGAELTQWPTPVYPAEARRRGEQGTVLLEIEVLIDGSVGDIRVIESPGHRRLVQAAIDAARRAKFKPAAVQRIAAQWIRVPFHFVIR